MRNYPTLDPVIVNSGSYFIDRLLDRDGKVEVGVGDHVAPGDVVARTGDIEKSFTLYLATELGVPNDSLRKYLGRPVGSHVTEGEPIARVRRGLRTAAVRSPASGVLVHVDDSAGTVTLTASTGPKELVALVSGVVEQIHTDRGVSVRTSGARLYGIVGFGDEAIGPLVIGSDRNDRELTADQVSKDWKGAVVLAGMTIGVPALAKLRDAGVAAVVVGSIAEADIRRFLSSEGGSDPGTFWQGNSFGSSNGKTSPVIVVTEGFGRIPMADPVYDILASKSGATVSVAARTVLGEQLSRPEIYVAGEEEEGGAPSGHIHPGRTVRVVEVSRPGMVGVVRSEVSTQATSTGIHRDVVDVEFETGDVSRVPVENIEVLL